MFGKVWRILVMLIHRPRPTFFLFSLFFFRLVQSVAVCLSLFLCREAHTSIRFVYWFRTPCLLLLPLPPHAVADPLGSLGGLRRLRRRSVCQPQLLDVSRRRQQSDRRRIWQQHRHVGCTELRGGTGGIGGMRVCVRRVRARCAAGRRVALVRPPRHEEGRRFF
jgi:hypothetical protein